MLTNVINLPKEDLGKIKVPHYPLFIRNKLLKQNEILQRKKNNKRFGSMFDQCLTNVSPMFGQRLGYRLRLPQMARFVLPNANTSHLTRSYTATYSLFNENEY